ncbi:uncharacterized protein FOMMEDRAFT_150346 [Fomitiporia mediterranea MF3/22]|uniref:uncharacterized protein n=1 Tax=Fomitiporia mediterranea (strain MF3/22) TaxID=694068 RepID=UPI0004408B53|nr:uncharacterized protein FOMMEDRAFT_150346 [Fomitiporia mediterranea MF3/22]EJD07795.1 hypothetical protein FOMMEDRAFT_150346 [Fomitiporia mediterranea MF3/22]
MSSSARQTRSQAKAQANSRAQPRGDSSVSLTPPKNIAQPCTRGRAGSQSTVTSGSMGINHWTRHMPNYPAPVMPHPGSEASTKIVTPSQLAESTSNCSRIKAKAMSNLSGISTEAPASFGHADSNSKYYQYQQAGTRVFDCEDPGVNAAAQARIVAQCVDALGRRLDISSMPEGVRFMSRDLLSNDGDARYDSPSPSVYMVPPSLSSRGCTPYGEVDNSYRAYSTSSRAQFDFETWAYADKALKDEVTSGQSRSGHGGTARGGAGQSMANGVKSVHSERHQLKLDPITDMVKIEHMSDAFLSPVATPMPVPGPNPYFIHGHESLLEDEVMTRPLGLDDDLPQTPLFESPSKARSNGYFHGSDDTVVEPTFNYPKVSGFGRECSPLTEYEYDEDGTPRLPNSSRRGRRTVGAVYSPSRGYVRTDPILTRKRAKELGSTVNM